MVRTARAYCCNWERSALSHPKLKRGAASSTYRERLSATSAARANTDADSGAAADAADAADAATDTTAAVATAGSTAGAAVVQSGLDDDDDDHDAKADTEPSADGASTDGWATKKIRGHS